MRRIYGKGGVLVFLLILFSSFLESNSFSSIEIIGEIKIMNGNASGVAKLGDYLYMAMNEGTHPVLVYDIKDPTKPRVVHYVEAPGWPVRPRVIDGKWLWTVFGNGEAIFDLKDPSKPRRLEPNEYPPIMQLERISKREWKPEFRGKKFIVHGNFSYSTCVGKNILYYGTYVNETKGETAITEIYDIKDPKNPKLLSTVEGHPTNLIGNLLFCYGKIYDVSDPSNPKKLAEFKRDDFPELVSNNIGLKSGAVYYEDGKLYAVVGKKFTKFWGIERGENVEGGHDGIAIFDARDWSKITLLGWYIPPLTQSPINLTSIVYHKGYILGSDTTYGLRVFDVRDPKNIQLVASDRQGGELSAVAYIPKRKLLCIGQNVSGGFVFVDVSNPSKPQILSKICVAPARIWGKMAVYKDRYLYAQGDWSIPRPGFTGLFIIDTEDPANPKVKLIGGIVGRAYGMLIVDNYLYTCGGSILDISDPENPKSVGSLPASGYQIAYKEPYLYISNFSPGELYVIDIKERTNPKLVSKLSLPSGHRVISMEFLGKYLFLGWCHRPLTEPGPRPSGLLIAIDTTDPTKPRIAKIWDTKKDLGFAERLTYTHVWTDGKYLFVGTYHRWLGMYEVIDGEVPSLKKIKEIGGLPSAWLMSGEPGIIYRICLGQLSILKY